MRAHCLTALAPSPPTVPTILGLLSWVLLTPRDQQGHGSHCLVHGGQGGCRVTVDPVPLILDVQQRVDGAPNAQGVQHIRQVPHGLWATVLPIRALFSNLGQHFTQPIHRTDAHRQPHEWRLVRAHLPPPQSECREVRAQLMGHGVDSSGSTLAHPNSPACVRSWTSTPGLCVTLVVQVTTVVSPYLLT